MVSEESFGKKKKQFDRKKAKDPGDKSATILSLNVYQTQVL